MLHRIPELQQAVRVVCLTLLGVWGTTRVLDAQTRSLDFIYGAWYHDTVATMWSAGYVAPLLGPLSYGIALAHVDDHQSLLNRTQTGADFSVGLGRNGSGPFLAVGTGLGIRHDDGSLAAHWSVGAGAAARLMPFLSVGAEGRFNAEDGPLPGRSGWALLGRMTLLWRSAHRPRHRAPSFTPPSRDANERAASDRGESKSASELAAGVVSTALDVMGTPYRWGGDDGNGYDCSGLIQYAYGQHGIILPRVSREQVLRGVAVEHQIEALAPGDILGFSVEGDQVTHVGLYVGQGQFIHSASRGVKVSSLSAADPDSAWWRQRWVVARRILR